MRVDVQGFGVVVGVTGISWEDGGGGCFGGGSLAILKMCFSDYFLDFMFVIVFFNKKN